MLLDFLLAAMAAVTVAVLLVPLLRRDQTATRRLDHDLAIYRDQLAEIERERAAGALTPEQANAARLEIERRILAAASRDESLPMPVAIPPPLDRMLPVALALVIPLAALGLYLDIGRPGLPSAPYDARRAAALQAPASGPEAMTPTAAQLVAEARARVAANPDNAEAQSAFGEALVIEADGTVGEPAVAAFGKALAADPQDARALFYLGLHEAQSGDSRAALMRWLDLEAKSPEDAPWMATLRGQIARVAKAADLDPQVIRPDRKPPPALPPPATGGMPAPTPEQREAMANLTPEQRQQAIRAMVEGLDARLKESPQDRAGWLRLANAWRVLGEAPRAAEAYARADALSALDAQGLSDWVETLVRQLAPGAVPPPAAIVVLTRLEKVQPNNALALFYLGAASFAAGDKPAALQRWKTLLALLPADAPIRGMLEAKIKEAE